MAWTRARKPDSSEAIIFKGEPCLTTEDHWNAFQETFNSAHKRDTYPTRLMRAIHPKPKWAWAPFSACELREALTGCSGRSAPGPDHIIWTHIKRFCVDDNILKFFVWIINACFVTGFWPDSFKTSKTVIIPKLDKKDYNIPKAFCPIVLLNTLGKLFEKVIANRLQWEAACFKLLHPCQFGGVRQNSTEDAGSYLTHLVRAGWTKGYKTSVVAFDLAQYFPSLNHSVITLLLDRMGFANVVVNFFVNYLVG